MKFNDAIEDSINRLPYVKLGIGQTIKGTFNDNFEPVERKGQNGVYTAYKTLFTIQGGETKEWDISSSLLSELKTRMLLRGIQNIERCIFAITKQDKKSQPYIVDIIGQDPF